MGVATALRRGSNSQNHLLPSLFWQVNDRLSFQDSAGTDPLRPDGVSNSNDRFLIRGRRLVDTPVTNLNLDGRMHDFFMDRELLSNTGRRQGRVMGNHADCTRVRSLADAPDMQI